MSNPKYTYRSKNILYIHNRIQLVEDVILLPDGNESTYLKYDGLQDGVVVIAINNQSKILINHEYTYPADKYVYQFPGGGVDEKEDPSIAAKRELQEECGYIANNIKLIGSFYYEHRRSHAKDYVFLAEDLQKTKPKKEPHEFIDTKWVNFKDLVNIVNNDEFLTNSSLAAWGLYLNSLINLQQK